MKLLALDTSSEGCSAALFIDGDVSHRFELAPRGHTRLLMPMVRDLLAESGLSVGHLDAMAFACGPGSFTGLRIATGVVQGLAWGADIPVVPVSSLEAVALQAIGRLRAGEGSGLAVAFDARMDEVYWGCYQVQDGMPEPLMPERVCAPESVTLPDGIPAWSGAGGGWNLRDRMPEAVVTAVTAVEQQLVPRAEEVARLAVRYYQGGRAVSAARAQPVYLRDEVTWQKLPGR